MHILNFAHPLTEAQLEQINLLVAPQTADQVITLAVQFDTSQAFEPQLAALFKAIPLSVDELQSLPILVNLPSLNSIAAMLLASLHGRMGYFPSILRLRPKPG